MDKTSAGSPEYDPQANYLNDATAQHMALNMFPYNLMMGNGQLRPPSNNAPPTPMPTFPQLFNAYIGYQMANTASTAENPTHLAVSSAPTTTTCTTSTTGSTGLSPLSVASTTSTVVMPLVSTVTTVMSNHVPSISSGNNPNASTPVVTKPVSTFRKDLTNCHDGEKFSASKLHEVLEEWTVKKKLCESRIQAAVQGLVKEGYKPYCDFSVLEEKCRKAAKEIPAIAPVVEVLQTLMSIQKFTNYFHSEEVHVVREKVASCTKDMDELKDKPCNKLTACKSNLKTAFMVPDLPPFRKQYIRDTLDGFLTPTNKATDKQMKAAFVHVLHRITEPASAIQAYTVRDRMFPKAKKATNADNAEEDDDDDDDDEPDSPLPKLTQLPDTVKKAMIGCGLEMVGFLEPEIYATKFPIDDLIASNTEYWRQLGANDEERAEKLKYNRSVVEQWRRILNTSLKAALKAVRYHTVDVSGPVPIWNSRHDKKTGATATQKGSRKRPNPT